MNYQAHFVRDELRMEGGATYTPLQPQKKKKTYAVLFVHKGKTSSKMSMFAVSKNPVFPPTKVPQTGKAQTFR